MKKLLTFSIAFLICSFFAAAQNGSPYWSLSGNNNESGTSKLGTTNKFSLHFYTNNSQRMYVDSSNGRVGIGTATPQDRLHVNSAAGENPFRAQINGSTKLLVASNGGVSIGQNVNAPANGLYVLGNTGINTNTPAYTLDVNGSAGVRNRFTVADGGATVTNSNGTALSVTATSSTGDGIYVVSNDYGIESHGDNAYGIYTTGYDGILSTSYGAQGYGVYGDGYGSQAKGAFFYSAYSTALLCTVGTGGQYAGYFNGPVYTTSTYNTSDARLKKNVAGVDNALGIINNLAPKYYEFRTDGDYAKMSLPAGKHYGLIAQDVESVLPALVKDSKFDVTDVDIAQARGKIAPADKRAMAALDAQRKAPHKMVDFKAVNYTELIPVLVKALQEEHAQKDSLSAKVNDLQSQMNEMKLLISKLSNGNINTTSMGYLKQNIPNPAGSNTIIGYVLPQNATNARIIITDAKGSLLKTFAATAGENQLNLSNENLPAGIYNYTLYAGNKVIDTKQMVVAK